jgi:hypothetical protein
MALRLLTMTRRDRCHFYGARAQLLNQEQAAKAWHDFARQVEGMGMVDVPKFRDLLRAFRSATICARAEPDSTIQPFNDSTGAP